MFGNLTYGIEFIAVVKTSRVMNNDWDARIISKKRERRVNWGVENEIGPVVTIRRNALATLQQWVL